MRIQENTLSYFKNTAFLLYYVFQWGKNIVVNIKKTLAKRRKANYNMFWQSAIATAKNNNL